MDGFEYVNGTLQKIHHTVGYVERKADGSFQYNYTLKDHLGNTRVTFADINGNGLIDPNTEINQINHYYPFGLNMEGNWNGANGANKYPAGTTSSDCQERTVLVRNFIPTPIIDGVSDARKLL